MKKYKPTIAVLNETRRRFPSLCDYLLDLSIHRVYIRGYKNLRSLGSGTFDDTIKLFFVYNPGRDRYIPVIEYDSCFEVVNRLGILRRLQLGINLLPYFVWRYGGNIKDFKVEVV